MLAVCVGWMGRSDQYRDTHLGSLRRARDDLLLNVKNLSRGHRRADIRPLASLSIIECGLHLLVALFVHLQDFALVWYRDMRIDDHRKPKSE